MERRLDGRVFARQVLARVCLVTKARSQAVRCGSEALHKQGAEVSSPLLKSNAAPLMSLVSAVALVLGHIRCRVEAGIRPAVYCR